MAAGILYVVATPIGNLEDITLRALSVLRSVTLVACEDTRRTRVLLQRHGIEAKLASYHKFNEPKASASIVARLEAGEDVALVSDGGTPAVSDPGYRLVRDALDAGITVTPIPGPAAFVAAVSASGLPSECVTFRGFLPHRAGERRRLIESIRGEPATQVFYDSPRRVAASLRDLAAILGERQAAVARELTKRFETWHRGTLSEVAEQVASAPLKGEFCIVIEGAPGGGDRARRDQRGANLESAPRGTDRAEAGEGNRPVVPPAVPGTVERARSAVRRAAGGAAERACGEEDLRRIYEEALASGLDRREALRRAARACGLGRKEAYRILHSRS